jgi:hypothetical protein
MAGNVSLSDTIVGGDGTDTITATMSAAVTKQFGSGTSAEIFTVDFDEAATFNYTNSSFTTINVVGDSAVVINNLASGVDTEFEDNDLGAVTLDYTADATGSFEFTTASAVEASTLAVTDAQTFTITAVGGSNTLKSFSSTVTLDATDTDTVTVKSGAAATPIEIDGAFAADNATSLTVTTSHVGSHITFGAAVMATADLLETLTISAGGGGSTATTSGITVGAIGATASYAAGALETITITAADGADVTMGAIDAEGASITSITASANTTGSTISFGTIGVSGTQITSIGEINLTAVSGATVDLDGHVYATTIGTITASGAGTINMDATTSVITTIEQFNAGSTSGTVAVDFTGATVAISATLGTGTTSYVTGVGGDTITLASGDGTDTINHALTTAGYNITTINNFQKGTDSVQLSLAESAVAAAIVSGQTIDLVDGNAADVGVAEVVVKEMTGDTTLAAGDDLMILVGATFASTSAVEDAIETGAYEITTATVLSADDAILLLYSDGTDAYLAIAEATNGPTANLADTETNVTNLVKLAGVTSIAAGDFVAQDFEIIT